MLALSVPCNTALTAFYCDVALTACMSCMANISNPVVRTKMYLMGRYVYWKRNEQLNLKFKENTYFLISFEFIVTDINSS